MAYRIPLANQAAVIAGLDHREKGGYAQHRVQICCDDGEFVEATVYVATPENPNYLGPQPESVIAEQIQGATGPSGTNQEYLLKLAETLRTMGASDPHVFAIERALLEKS